MRRPISGNAEPPQQTTIPRHMIVAEQLVLTQGAALCVVALIGSKYSATATIIVIQRLRYSELPDETRWRANDSFMCPSGNTFHSNDLPIILSIEGNYYAAPQAQAPSIAVPGGRDHQGRAARGGAAGNDQQIARRRARRLGSHGLQNAQRRLLPAARAKTLRARGAVRALLALARRHRRRRCGARQSVAQEQKHG